MYYFSSSEAVAWKRPQNSESHPLIMQVECKVVVKLIKLAEWRSHG